jgi:predicted GIY-YIG superfamily endonuclease
MNKNHYCYILRNNYEPDKNRTYNGYTTNLTKRIRQHNQEIKGGARYTKLWGNKTWEYIAIIEGNPDNHHALQCEWKIKHPTNQKIRPKKFNSPEGRILSLNDIFLDTKWTSNSKYNINEININVYLHNNYIHLLQNIFTNIKIYDINTILKKKIDE